MKNKRLLSYYQENFSKFGVHERSLGWTKGKQNLRFFQLSRHFQLQGSSVLDIGCGFGDFNRYLATRQLSLSRYTGIDVVPDFIDIAKSQWSGSDKEFLLGNYLDMPGLQADFVLASGIFGLRVGESDEEQYEYLRSVLAKAFTEARIGVAFDFLSDKVEFRTGSTDFHASPARVLSIGYEFSKNILLDNSAMPFEFSLVLFKDDSFKPATTVFNSTLAAHPELVEVPS